MADNQLNSITPDVIKQDFKIVKNFADDHIQRAIDSAVNQVKSDQIEATHVDEATTSFAKHLLYRDWFMSYGGVQSAGTFGNSQSMVNFNGSDPYLLNYNDIVDKYGTGQNMGAIWTES
ncbi:hypothetical protein [Lentilactobacillus kosonis]|uniref:Uncharacterized protein n=1 Tax=Lentilactobacillus kosonis TaxID=2810561 RepID=A0A401FPJ1_9LACO|nr:hypothetical protein [Lentilactobacillus kosonis]GAY74274.1 hypothetical protein NBRC111893_2420 [Lentilactobacillus kosonis]